MRKSLHSIYRAATERESVTTPAGEPPADEATRRLGFLEGDIPVPDDFDQMGKEEIEEMFYGH